MHIKYLNNSHNIFKQYITYLKNVYRIFKECITYFMNYYNTSFEYNTLAEYESYFCLENNLDNQLVVW